MPSLRTLSEAECYARLYGRDAPMVTIVHFEPRRPRPRDPLVGETLRRLFEDRLDARDAAAVDEEAA